MSKKQARSGARSWLESSVFLGGPGKRWTLWVSWIVVGSLVAISLVVLFWPTHSTTSTSPASTSAAGSAAPAADSCPTSDWDDAAVEPPRDLRWLTVAGNAWPTSETDGPTRTFDGLRRCFAHSPVGAALAAVNLTQSLRTADLVDAHHILDSQYVQNDGKSIADQDVDTYFPQQPVENRKFGAVVGYTFVGYSADLTRVVLVEKWPHRNQFTGYTVTLEWHDNDWQVLLDASGQPSPDGEITIDPEAFTYWEVPE
ncbi:hypothetical protein [Plantibacter sp. CFBP 8804]|uniref:hypothetical protein n=1 Tax=Plantibacter sp. CFBP 8804 TaxID=2775270 RepID=UPI0017819DB0|nr:hypothetical protein [Plantibacter sp. CFBP 8804]MBD8519143.1 hypothetical protein [Plantibacter sp. CFBP 8804]